MTPAAPVRVPIREEADVAVARAVARAVALDEGLSASRAAAVATAVSEVAWNILVHAGAGEILVDGAGERGRRGVVVVARDEAGGVGDVARALEDGYSTRGGLGLGLPAARRIMDEFALASAAGRGTTVTMTKWAHAAE